MGPSGCEGKLGVALEMSRPRPAPPRVSPAPAALPARSQPQWRPPGAQLGPTPTQSHLNLDPRSPGLPVPGALPASFQPNLDSQVRFQQAAETAGRGWGGTEVSQTQRERPGAEEAGALPGSVCLLPSCPLTRSLNYTLTFFAPTTISASLCSGGGGVCSPIPSFYE